MKAKKTIRRMPPRARKLAKLQRELFSLQRRMGVIIEEVALIEIEARADLKTMTRQAVMISELQAATTCRDSEPDKPADPPASTGKNGAEIAGQVFPSLSQPFPSLDCVCGD